MVKGGISLRVISFVLVFICSYGSAREFKLNPNFKMRSLSPESKYIFDDYMRFMNIVKNKSLHTKLVLVNDYLNGLNGIYDDKKGVSDYWSSRSEFLSRGGGDCEDYSIAKYYTLKDLGFKSNDMCLLVVKDRYSTNNHMILSVWTKGETMPKVLDNLSFKILPLSKRVDLIPKYCVNENGYYKIDKKGNRKKAHVRFRAYEKMLKRQKREKIWLK